MTLPVHLSCFLALLLAGQGLGDYLLTKDAGPRPLELKEVFKLFQIQFNRSYSNPAEYTRRLAIFAHNLAQAQRLQQEDLGTAEFGETPFSDLTEEEFGQLYGHQRAPERIPNMAKKVESQEWGESVPPTCDWRKAKNIISSIKNQEKCRCCWAMAAADNIQALWRIKHQKFVDVSVQELLDCDRCGNGCKGGFVWDAYITVLNYSGLASEQDYPFQGHQKPHRCLAKKYKKVAWIQDFTMLSRNEQGLPEGGDQGHTQFLRPSTCGPLCLAGGFRQGESGHADRDSLVPSSQTSPLHPLLDPEELLGRWVGREGSIGETTPVESPSIRSQL
ncbi:cathepsin W isoform X5 [Apodemus sylvaticus]|uniref:cathepsin W isoform X5 n=1 Tax=Apodemus sylvaticus TaxID=10129 RepID=UPI0022426056|nr:cathepsin W isoform X5 [Apodemus sylvaticus]